MSEARVIKVSEEFSPTPFGRYRSDGEESGQVFRERLVGPALRENSRVVLDVDGVAGLPSSFWEETLGGLIREGWTAEDLRNKLDIVATSSELRVYVRLGWRYVDEADKKAKSAA